MNYFNLIIFILTLNFVVEQILAFLNLRNQRLDIPKEVAEFYNREKYLKSLRHDSELTKLSFYDSSFNFLFILAIFFFGGFGWLDTLLRNFTNQPIPLALLFFGVLLLVSDLLTLPFQLYRTFVIEEKYGFNTITAKIFITDKLKVYLIAAIAGGLVLSVLIYLMQALGSAFWIWSTVVLLVLILFARAFYTSLIVPLFNKLTPLSEGELKSAILEYSSKVGFPINNVYIMDGSKRSKEANAFFSGFGKKKKIVLYDTLVQNHSTEELVAVLAHEVGHYKKKHLVGMYLLSVMQVVLILFILSLMVFNTELSVALGGSGQAIHLNLLASSILFSPLTHFLNMFAHMLSRRNEFQADAYAKQTFDGLALSNALKKLSVDNLSTLYPHPLYVLFHYSHPPLLRRIKALETML